MNKILIVAFVAAAAFVGCQKSEPGGRGGDDTFKVVVPALSTTVKQGEIQTVRVSVERNAGFKQAVKLDVKAPTGLAIDPSSTTVKPGDKGEVQLEIKAATDAPLGEQTVRIMGTPDKGEPTETQFKVTISAK